jgi:hypothetical protein
VDGRRRVGLPCCLLPKHKSAKLLPSFWDRDREREANSFGSAAIHSSLPVAMYQFSPSTAHTSLRYTASSCEEFAAPFRHLI